MEKEGSNLYNNLTKKETQTINREKVKLADQHRGIKDMRRLPEAVLVVDAQYENTAILEAKRLDIPVIAIVDSNTDPEKVDYPIPANDDSIRTIQLIVAVLADAVNEAKGIAAQKENDVHEDAADDSGPLPEETAAETADVQETEAKEEPVAPDTPADSEDTANDEIQEEE